jgi:hypothetical protein
MVSFKCKVILSGRYVPISGFLKMDEVGTLVYMCQNTRRHNPEFKGIQIFVCYVYIYIYM